MTAQEIADLQDARAASLDNLGILIVHQHTQNGRLWNLEDSVRAVGASPIEVARFKHQIDYHNQQRNDFMEAIDEHFKASYPFETGRRWSETPGLMIDRLSILALKIHHRKDKPEQAENLKQLHEQRADLIQSLQHFMDQAAEGKAWFKVYRQHKMYGG